MTPEQKEVILRLELYKLTRSELREKIVAMIEACPKFTFAALKEAKLPAVFLQTSGYSDWNRTSLFLLESLTKGGAQAFGRYSPKGSKIKFTKKSLDGDLYLLTSDLQNLMRVSHEQMIVCAKEAGLEIPLANRVEYPLLFLDVPDFIKPEHVKNFVSRTRFRDLTKGGIYTMFTDVHECLEHEHESIRRLVSEKAIATAKVPRLGQDYEDYIARHKENIVFYRWIEPHFMPGGIFAPEKRHDGEGYLKPESIPQGFLK